MNLLFLGLGSNIGDKFSNIKKTIEKISDSENFNILKSSSIYETPPKGYEEQAFFLNCVLKTETNLNINEVLPVLQKIEKEIGRKKTFKWGPRVIDIDILFFNDVVADYPDLIVPHPYIAERAFVLVPFSEIEKDFIHPVYKKSIKELLSQLPEKEVKDIKKFSFNNY